MDDWPWKMKAIDDGPEKIRGVSVVVGMGGELGEGEGDIKRETDESVWVGGSGIR